MSQLFLKDLIIEAKHGVHEYEKINPQRFSITVKLEVDTPKAFISDDIEDTVSYSDLRNTIIEITKNNSFELLERLAQVICDDILVDKRIKELTISIEKLDIYSDTVPGIRVTRLQS